MNMPLLLVILQRFEVVIFVFVTCFNHEFSLRLFRSEELILCNIFFFCLAIFVLFFFGYM